MFPDVTICKVAQLNALYTSTLNYSRYISDTLARRDRWPFSRVKLFMPNTTQSTYNAVWRYFLSKEGYYNSLPRDFHGMDNQESLDNPILINCHAILGHSVSNVDCARFVQISWHRRYSKCLVLDLPDSLRTVREVVLSQDECKIMLQ